MDDPTLQPSAAQPPTAQPPAAQAAATQPAATQPLASSLAVTQTAAPADPSAANRDKSSTEIDTRELFNGRREIVLRHFGEAYRLSITRAGKLILRK